MNYRTLKMAMELKGRVLVYSILGCPHCMKAKSILQELGVPYTDVSLEKYPHARQDVQMRTQKRTVPQIFFNARHIGGNEDLQNLVIKNIVVFLIRCIIIISYKNILTCQPVVCFVYFFNSLT
jgi:glutaredoxin